MNNKGLSYSFRNTSQPVFVLDDNWTIVQVNESLLTLLGYTEDVLTGTLYSDMIPEKSVEEFEHFRIKCKYVGRLKNILADMKKASGEYLKVTLDTFAEYDDDGRFMYAVNFAEPADESLPNYDQIFNSTTVPLLVYDSNTLDIMDVNTSACRFYGYTYEEMVGMNITDINVDSRERINMYLDEVRNSGEPKTFIFRHRLKNGEIRYVDAWPSTLIYEGKNYNFTVLTDITERYRKEQNLKAVAEFTTQLLKTDTEISEISKMVVDSVKRLTGSTDGYAGSLDEDSHNLMIHAFSLGRTDAHGHDGPLMFSPDEDGKYRGLWGHTLNTGRPFYTNDVANCEISGGLPEWHVRIKNFISYPVEIDGILVGQISAANSPEDYTDADVLSIGELAKLYAVAIRFQKEHQLETLYTTMAENTNDGITILKPDFQGDFIVKFINKAALEPTLYTREQMVGAKLAELFPAMRENGQLEVFTKVFNTGEPEYQARMRYQDKDHDVWFENYFFRLHNRYIVALHRDITELVHSADALAASEHKYRSYISNSPDPIIVTNDKGEIQEVNEATCEKFEYTAEELMKMKIYDLWPDYLQDEHASNLHINQQKESFKVMHPHISKSGQIFHMRAHVKVMPDGNMIGVLQDMTERVHMQYELNELNADLQRRVKEEIALREKQEKAMFEQKKLADMGQMMNAIAHQWRQPLNGLGLFIEYITDRYHHEKLTKDDMEEFHSVTENLIQHLSTTIDDFKDFCKPDSKPVEFEVVKEVSRIFALIESQLTMHNIKSEIRCACPHKSATMTPGKTDVCTHSYTKVMGYPGEFKQAMLNIIYNAVDSMDETIAKGLVPCGELKVDIYADTNNIKLVCSDNGTGISDDIIENIFDPYFTTKEEGKGTGIGLYMAKLVIEKHMGGQISAGNNEGHGAVFEISFPVVKS
ncbi:MAG: PAS domain S-box protein [Deferribacterales bacterium]